MPTLPMTAASPSSQTTLNGPIATPMLRRSGSQVRLIVKQLLLKAGWQDGPLALRDLAAQFS